MDWEFLWKSVLLGVLQGLTEFLPISSSGHLAIAGRYLGVSAPGVSLEVALHLGTLVAVFLYFRRDIASLVRSFFIWCGSVVGRDHGLSGYDQAAWQRDMLIISGIILGSVPTGLIGIFGKEWFKGLFERIDAVGIFLLVTAALLAAAEWSSRKRSSSGKKSRLIPSWWESIVIGVLQGAAIAPGISRSGATVSAGLMLGIEPVSAARFSFLLGIPAILGAAVLSAPDIERAPFEMWAGFISGAAVAAVVGYAAIAVFIGALRRGKVIWFALYCFLLGSTVVVFSKIVA